MSGQPAGPEPVGGSHSHLVRVDLHNHTHCSPDSILSPEQFATNARRRKLDWIAVTDHNTTRGVEAVRAAAAAKGVRVIPGEEVRTAEGEMLALFLREEIPRGLSPEETIERVKAQGGLIGVPHPFDYLRSALQPEAMARVADRIDFVEGMNARMVFSAHNDRAMEFARERGLPLSAGSDSHSRWEVGRAYVEMADFDGPEQFLESLKAGSVHGRLSSPFIHMISRYATIRRRLGWRPA